ncbi:MAG: hypothetical protein HY684_00760 [Chloroflexi bacterium]|nr:hypothetical protein [Chloroflexota bacterium]
MTISLWQRIALSALPAAVALATVALAACSAPSAQGSPAPSAMALAQPTATAPPQPAAIPAAEPPRAAQATTPIAAPAKGEASASQDTALTVSRTSKQGPVTIEARLASPHPAGDTGPIRFSLILDTHSVDLDVIDLAASATLQDDRGRSVAALRWEAPRGGHHVQGALTFPGALPDGSALHHPAIKSLEIVVTNVGNVSERRLVWDLAAGTPAAGGP